MVYVDAVRSYPTESIKPEAQKFGSRWCHCWADDTSELIQFCCMAGWPVAWLQRKGDRAHVDLVPSQRRVALRLGAREGKITE